MVISLDLWVFWLLCRSQPRWQCCCGLLCGNILRARQLVGVRGAGLAYDGLYYVKTVTHNIKRGEYKQSFTLTRDGLISQTPKVPL